MRTGKVIQANDISSLSQKGNPNWDANDNVKALYPFPYYGGIFSEAARRQKAVLHRKAKEGISGTDKESGLYTIL
jgi:hypothetical protein